MPLRPELQTEDPIHLFESWLRQAELSEVNDANAAALATATSNGRPSVRMVLVKQVSADGFCFYTNEESQKGEELHSSPYAALCFHWKSMRRQVRVAGPVSSLPADVSDTYFHSRSRRSQIGAAVSQQSRPLDSRETLELQVATFSEEHRDSEIPRPPFWHGYAVKPERIEFWIDGKDRLHDRLQFQQTEHGWSRTLLYP